MIGSHLCLDRPDYYPDQSKSKGTHRVDGDYVSRLLFEEKVQESLSKDETIKVKKTNRDAEIESLTVFKWVF